MKAKIFALLLLAVIAGVSAFGVCSAFSCAAGAGALTNIALAISIDPEFATSTAGQRICASAHLKFCIVACAGFV